MPTEREINVFWSYIRRPVDRIVECLDGLREEDLNWKPLENANSLYVLATHMMGNLEEVVLGVLCGEGIGSRQRDSEFRVAGSSGETAKQRWKELQGRIASSLAQLPQDALDREYDHPRRGKLSGREILLIVVAHAAEHRGQADLTLDLLTAARGRPPLPKDAFGRVVR